MNNLERKLQDGSWTPTWMRLKSVNRARFEDALLDSAFYPLEDVLWNVLEGNLELNFGANISGSLWHAA